MRIIDKNQIKSEKIYTITEVSSGVAVATHNFRHFEDAQRCLNKLRKQHNLDEDDVQIFENIIG